MAQYDKMGANEHPLKAGGGNIERMWGITRAVLPIEDWVTTVIGADREDENVVRQLSMGMATPSRIGLTLSKKKHVAVR